MPAFAINVYFIRYYRPDTTFTGFPSINFFNIVSPVFTNSDKGKYKSAGYPVDACFAPTEAEAETKNLITYYNTK